MAKVQQRKLPKDCQNKLLIYSNFSKGSEFLFKANEFDAMSEYEDANKLRKKANRCFQAIINYELVAINGSNKLTKFEKQRVAHAHLHCADREIRKGLSDNANQIIDHIIKAVKMDKKLLTSLTDKCLQLAVDFTLVGNENAGIQLCKKLYKLTNKLNDTDLAIHFVTMQSKILCILYNFKQAKLCLNQTLNEHELNSVETTNIGQFVESIEHYQQRRMSYYIAEFIAKATYLLAQNYTTRISSASSIRVILQCYTVLYEIAANEGSVHGTVSVKKLM